MDLSTLINEIKEDLTDKGQCFVTFVPSENLEADQIIKNGRKLARQAGKELKWKIATRAVRRDEGIALWAVLLESTPEHMEALHERSRARMEAVFNDLFRSVNEV